MASLIENLDLKKQIGENGHVEYCWSNNITEKICQFSFQLTRTNTTNVEKLRITLEDILNKLTNGVNSFFMQERQICKGYLTMLYKMIGHTRDIVEGKGEYALTYMMIYTWYKFYPNLAFFALKCLVDNGLKSDIVPYGSWKDIKYFCDYCVNKQNLSQNDPLIKYAISLLNNQLQNDYSNFVKNNYNEISLAAKWAPREKSKFGWLYELLACDYFIIYIFTATEDKHNKAVLKCKTEYRKILSALNKCIDTLQIKQCNHEWANIDFNRVTSISLAKQKKAFLNVKKNGETRFPENEDRNMCAFNFKNHIQKAVSDETVVKGKRIGLNDFTKQAINILRMSSEDDNYKAEYDLLNLQWANNATQNECLGKMIAMVDVSGSMEGESMNAAIALGIRIAEKSALGKRVMTFSAYPSWVNLETCNDFISQVKVIKSAPWGTNTNFYAALDMILNAIIEVKMSAEDVQDLMLVILSDMQMDEADKNTGYSLYENIKEKYADAGIRTIGKPYKPPHILFWNLRSTSGFPTLYNQSNASMMSGFSPALLNIFCDKGLHSLQSCTPWSLLEKSLSNERYKLMENYIDKMITI